MKKMILAMIAVFVAWSVIDMLVHGFLLMDTYKETKHLWRPFEEMKGWLLHLVTVVIAVGFVLVFGMLHTKNLKTGLKFGAILGVTFGFSMGYGTYSYTPIPYILALSWFIATVIQGIVSGLITGAILKE